MVFAGGALVPGGVATIVTGLPYAEAVYARVDWLLAAVNARDFGQPGSPLEAPAELIDLFRLADGVHFDASVSKIANVAGNAQLGGRALGEKPEADALHASADEVPPGDSPARSRHLLSIADQGARFVTEDTTPSRTSTVAMSSPIARKRMRSI